MSVVRSIEKQQEAVSCKKCHVVEEGGEGVGRNFYILFLHNNLSVIDLLEVNIS